MNKTFKSIEEKVADEIFHTLKTERPDYLELIAYETRKRSRYNDGDDIHRILYTTQTNHNGVVEVGREECFSDESLIPYRLPAIKDELIRHGLIVPNYDIIITGNKLRLSRKPKPNKDDMTGPHLV